MHPIPIKVKQYIKQALDDDQMRTAVFKATKSAVEKRLELVDGMPYWEATREAAHLIKQDVLNNLADYLELFEKRCRENGITVHWAETAEEGRRIITELARERQVKKIVKSKSLTTEEINLNEVLIKSGIETVETDLGEYIVQLEEKIPSHLIMPALHLSRQDVGRIFEEKLGMEYTDDPHALLGVARKKLREHFLTADMGITGVNFGIAESGTVCIIENEANARLSMSMPKIQVAVMGLEKLIPSIKDLPVFLKMLAPSATGQLSSTFVNIVGGASREKYREGPEEVHIVLLDNGRSRIAQDPVLKEALSCIRCGACLNTCPVYQQIGGHAYGWVYMGPIGSVLIPQYLGEDEGRYPPFMCSLCGACRNNCPVKINLPDHLLTMRNRVVEAGKSPPVEKAGIKGWAFLAKHPALYRFATWFPGKFQMLLPKNRSFPAPGYSRERALGRFDKLGFRKRFLKK